MTHSATLLGVPTEMFDLIVESTESKDLKHLRLVSRECAAKVLGPFKKNYIHSREVKLATESSIANTIKAIEHPEFGRLVRELVLVDNTASSPTEGEFRGLENGAAALGRATAVYQAQRFTRHSGEDRRLLTELFAETAEIEALRVEYRSWDDGWWTASGAWLVEGGEFRHEWDPADDHCFCIAMLAIAASSARFDTFRMSTQHGRSIPLSQWGEEYQKAVICKAALSHFDDLHLVFNANDPDDGSNSQPARDFLAMLAQLNICSLEVQSADQWGSANGPTVSTLMEYDFPYLMSLEFGEILLRWDELVSFLKRQESLDKLQLSFSRVEYAPRDLVDTTECDELSRASGVPDVTQVGVQFDFFDWEESDSE
ncbi:unnamed protein product [Zymoseptoria tritici ST99CH_1E4]|uniref:F-box domain-containing protein n=1 Tax=Zymoseptoria tritici ST99CH_1E4 TaxID=1276532 RepID=A0A2H1H853_ZYMTR|nr:unnamed protein product [Zymoseptoria tritici ST99CH_1E4]